MKRGGSSKRRTIASLAIGAVIGLFPAAGAVASQAPEWLPTEPEMTDVSAQWSFIPAEPGAVLDPVLYGDEMAEADRAVSMGYGAISIAPRQQTHTRDEEVIKDYWSFMWGYPNDPDIPDEIEEAANIYGQMFDICPELLESIACEESRYVPDVKDASESCWGCMQVNIHSKDIQEKIAAYGLTNDDMLEADSCMMIAAAYLSDLFDEYIDPAEVLYRYNGGKTALAEYRRTGKVGGYAGRVLERAYQMEEAHGKHELDDLR